jgi:hypothetical protein
VVGNGHKVAAISIFLHSASSLAARLVARSKFLNLRHLNCNVQFGGREKGWRQVALGVVPHERRIPVRPVMDTLRSVVRFLGIVVTLLFVVAVPGTFADEINRGRHEGSLIQSEAVGTSWNSGRFGYEVTSGWREGSAMKYEAVETFWGGRFADLSSGHSFGQGEIFGRTNGIRDGYWWRLSLDEHGDKWVSPSDTSTAMPEPGTFLLLANGVSFLLFARRRTMKA